ncbi:imidazole glycerol phosphate synthase subunit HisH [Cellvibrio japonicus]|uniref:Imidazole glycerol phosphate synthase subunit HisH n=1 Tax=Cellvibrio japonicus (strain Ueda107) TaxID=498211 RepID=B3PGA2_CELJU|nr:imidazole glycerol phosphate synthase subunit HisH [Cellvibrio japonicus]ACE85505.1 imidazole glycerol phosphate synthase, glutamine amidotransferase subunit [Cellvibrio japonicus Ueda107]QEI10904.1 imidazole glycerol phosphate synthase subunit HisH [Cellvibrio japonicus]QEI14480.1 imidazole glycerol phosphate synthase subunit HisH [Cellvibrio japonicus]QEI18058.1 imidazole glycerol phosphate synthase subunit HisH [Cellvibrio japonicus]
MAQQTVAVIDYGMGNLHSVASALAQVAPEQNVIVTADPAAVAAADRVVFPGVGAIRDCMAEIKRLGFDTLLREQIATGKPVLGICVGMQALMDHSEENGGVDCIGMLPGQVKFFGEQHKDAQGNPLKVPHMGWNQVHHNHHPLWADIAQDSRFYFVHSFYIHADEPSLVAATCDYGLEFHAALARDNLFAVQFHPEKSHTVGLQLLKNFLHWDGRA